MNRIYLPHQIEPKRHVSHLAIFQGLKDALFHMNVTSKTYNAPVNDPGTLTWHHVTFPLKESVFAPRLKNSKTDRNKF